MDVQRNSGQITNAVLGVYVSILLGNLQHTVKKVVKTLFKATSPRQTLVMARLEYIDFTPHRAAVLEGTLSWNTVKGGQIVESLPQIVWMDGSPWREVNIWALTRATSRDVRVETVQSDFSSLLKFANWLEESQTSWLDFPMRRSERCLVKFRGWLIEQREKGRISPSNASKCMGCTIKLYRWFLSTGMLRTEYPAWANRIVPIRIHDSVGFERTINVNSTDLVIRNRKAPGELLEDGLLPVSAACRNEILLFARENFSQEVFLILSLGFFTGMRLQTIANLKLQTLERAVAHPLIPEMFLLSVGPGATPPVSTKFGVTGQILIHRLHLEELKTYAYGVHRLQREAKAIQAHRNLVFLTRYGSPYARDGSDKSTAMNVEMARLRRLGKAASIKALFTFKFHQSRCTFATEVASIAVAAGNKVNAISIVKEFLLHRREATAFRYIKFVQKTPVKIAVANEFSRALMGVIDRPKQS